MISLFRRAGGQTLLLVALLLTAGAPAVAAEPPPSKELLKRFLKCWETGDQATFASLLHSKVVFGYPGGRFDREQLLKTFETYRTQKSEIRIYFGDVSISDGKKHFLNYQFAATDRESGKRFAVGTGVVCELEDGKIVALREYWDTRVPAMQRAGELPLDEGVVTPWPVSVWLRADTIN